MATLIPIDASKARNDFFKILQRVYGDKETFLIKKAGIPMAKIQSVDEFESTKKSIMDFAGAWKKYNVEAPELVKYIYEGRKDRTRLKRKLPKFT